MLARLLLSMPSSKVGRRTLDGAPVPDHVRAAYRACLGNLLRVAPPAPDASPRLVNLTGDAEAAWRAFSLDVESKLAHGGALASLRDWGGKLAGAVARIAGILHFVEQAGSSGFDVQRAGWGPVSVETMDGAIALGRYFESHALRAFGDVMTNTKANEQRQRLEAAAWAWRALDREGAGLTAAEALRRLWPEGHRGEAPEWVAEARGAVADFAGARGNQAPSSFALGTALRSASKGGRGFERAGFAHRAVVRWRVSSSK